MAESLRRRRNMDDYGADNEKGSFLYTTPSDSQSSTTHKWLKAIGIILLALIPISMAAISLHYSRSQSTLNSQALSCADTCSYTLAESIPVGVPGLSLSPDAISTYDLWMQLISNAQKSIDIAAFYVTLSDDTSLGQGPAFLAALVSAAQRGVKIRIAANSTNYIDTQYLESNGYAQVRSLNFNKVYGSGIIHTKFILVDESSLYVGSANLDWRSLTEVKEFGIGVQNCACLATDLQKVFESYWTFAGLNSLPPSNGWSSAYSTSINEKHQIAVNFTSNADYGTSFISMSPPVLVPFGRTPDLQAVLDVINNATSSLCIEVMDYLPVPFTSPPVYFAAIDDAIRSAAMNRGVNVRILVSNWTQSANEKDMFVLLNSLVEFGSSLPYISSNVGGSIQVRVYQLPDKPTLQYVRVNHAKFALTDKNILIGTSNWSPDYFLNTAGVSFVSTHPGLRQSIQTNIFDRDWNSQFAQPLSRYLP